MPLLETMIDKRTVFFLGAGSSWDSGMPLGDQGAQAIIRSCFDTLEKPDLWTKLDSVTRNSSEITWPRFEVVLDILSQFLPSAMLAIVHCFKGVGLSSTQQLLASICSEPHLWLTTNFDDQIESALARYGNSFRVVSDRKTIEQLTPDELTRHLVVKLHGDDGTANPERDLGVRIDQILRAFPLAAGKSLAGLAFQRPVLFLGYAARDPDLFQLIEDLIRGSESVSWVGLKEPAISVQALMRRYPRIEYYEGGTPRALEKASNRIAAPPRTELTMWFDRVNDWLRSVPREAIAQSLASICLERNDEVARVAVEELHDCISTTDRQHTLWKLDREIEWYLRSPEPQRSRLDEFQSRLGEMSGSSIKDASGVGFKALMSSADLYWRTADVKKACEQMELVVDACPESNHPILRLNALTKLGIYQTYLGSSSMEAGFRTLELACNLARKLDLPIQQLEATQNLGICLMRADQADRAEQLLLGLEPTVREIGNPRRTLVWMMNIAEAYRYQRKFEQATKMNEALLEKAEIYGDDEVLMKGGNNLGLCYLVLGNVGAAEKSFQESLSASKRRNGGEAIFNALYNLGWLRVLLGQWQAAVPFFEEAADGYKLFGAAEREGGARSLLSWCKFRLGLRTESESILKEIQKSGIVPQGVFRSEYKLIEFIHTNDLHQRESTLLKAGAIFPTEPEQRYYLAAWMLDNVENSVATQSFESIVRFAYEAALQSGIAIHHSTLAELLNRKDTRVPRELIETIKRASKGSLFDFVDSIRS